MSATPHQLYTVLEEFIMQMMSLSESDGMDAMIDLDLSFSQARTLFVLAKRGEALPINTIAECIGLSDAAAGRNVEQLLKLDLVERRESSDDRRVKLVSLTEAGTRVSLQHMDSKRASIKRFTAALPADQRDQLHHALTDILAGDALRPGRSGRDPQENTP